MTAGSVQRPGGSVAGCRAAGRFTVTLALRGAGRAVVLKRVKLRGLRPSAARRVRVRAGVPAGLSAGRFGLVACADSRRRVRERSESNNCRTVGSLAIAAIPQPQPPGSSFPTLPIPFDADTDSDLRTYLLPHLDDGWSAPAQ